MDIVIYDMKKLGDEHEYLIRYEEASVYRKEKARGARKYENIGAAAVIDEALRPYGLCEKNIEYEYGPQGKPYIKGSHIYFNISHSGDYAVCAVSENEVGIDIQKTGKVHLGLARRHFTKEEYALIMSAEDEISRKELFYRIWAIKESFVKAIGCGIGMPFNLFNVGLFPSVKVTYNWDDIEKYIGGRFGENVTFNVKEIECDMEDYIIAVTEIEEEENEQTTDS